MNDLNTHFQPTGADTSPAFRIVLDAAAVEIAKKQLMDRQTCDPKSIREVLSRRYPLATFDDIEQSAFKAYLNCR